MRMVTAVLAAVVVLALVYPFHFRARAFWHDKSCEVTLSLHLKGHDLTLWCGKFTLKQDSLLRHGVRFLMGQKEGSGREVRIVDRIIRLLRVGREVRIRSTLQVSAGDAALSALAGGVCSIAGAQLERWLRAVLPQGTDVIVGVKAATSAGPALKCSVECRGRFSLARSVWSYMRG